MSPTWLLLVHQLPPRPTNVRVKTWRRLQDLGAIGLRNSVWVLPATPQAREDFEWMKSEIETMNGEAMVFAAETLDARSNDEVVAAFRHAREGDFSAIQRDAARLATALGQRRVTAAGRPRLARQVRLLEGRLARVDAATFYPPANREAAAVAVARLRSALTAPAGDTGAKRAASRAEVKRFQRRTWHTRPRPGVDRMSSAWLIRRFIDPHARFAFADTPPAGRSAIAFDMYGGEFSHTGAGCTFETLAARFGLDAPPIRTIGEIVHDLDLKETRFGRPEAPAIERLVDGLRATFADDRELLEQGIVLFEALFRSLERATPASVRRGRQHRAD